MEYYTFIHLTNKQKKNLMKKSVKIFLLCCLGTAFFASCDRSRSNIVHKEPESKLQLKIDEKEEEDYDKVIIERKDYANGKSMLKSTKRKAVANQNIYYTYSLDDTELSKSEYNTESYNYIEENNYKNAKESPLSTFSIDVDEASYTNCRRYINLGNNPPVDAVRIEEFINYFDYRYPQPKNHDPFSVVTEYGPCPWNQSHKLLHVGIQGKKYAIGEIPAFSLVFLVDVSGSMSDANKLPLLKESLKLLTKQLRPQDKVAIVVYAGAAGLVLPATSDKNEIINALSRLEAGGSTAGGEGIQLAYKVAMENFQPKGCNRVILATDGDFNVGQSSDAEMVRLLEEKRNQGVFLTTLGFGMGNYKDSKMEEMADKGNGNNFYIDSFEEARKVLVTDLGSTLNTIAKDVKIQIEFNPQHVASYRLIGYENRKLNDEDFNDDKKDAGELGAGHTVTALYEIVPVGTNSDVAPKIDPLKYQNKTISNNQTDELGTIKLRYKLPDQDKSLLLSQVINHTSSTLDKTSDNFRFSAAVASFGMLLRNSQFKGDANYNDVISMAQLAKGNDEEGYRNEFIKLVKTAQNIKN